MPLIAENVPMISLTKSRAKTFTVTVYDQAGATKVLTGGTVLFTVKTDYGSTGTQVFQKTLTGGESGAVFASGVVAIAVTAADTSSFAGIPDGKPHVDLIWDMKVTLSGSALGTLFNGNPTGKLRLFQTLG